MKSVLARISDLFGFDGDSRKRSCRAGQNMSGANAVSGIDGIPLPQFVHHELPGLRPPIDLFSGRLPAYRSPAVDFSVEQIASFDLLTSA
jgi:hypothetical protein